MEDFISDEVTTIFYVQKLEKTSKSEFRIEKVIKKKDDKLYVK